MQQGVGLKTGSAHYRGWGFFVLFCVFWGEKIITRRHRTVVAPFGRNVYVAISVTVYLTPPWGGLSLTVAEI